MNTSSSGFTPPGSPPPAGPTGRVCDERLSAWLDGELPADEQAAVQAWLRANPDAAARVRLWAADAEALRVRMAPLLDEPVPAALHEVLARRRFSLGAVPRWALAAGLVAVLVTGGLLGAGLQRWGSGPPPAGLAQLRPQSSSLPPAPWVQRAAAAHAVYVPEPRHAVEVGAREEHLARWLTRRIEVPVKLFDLRAQGFELVGGRLLPDGSGKSAQLMYQDAQGVRVTVYLRKPEVGTPAAFRYERQGELGLFYWVESGAGYALVGPLPKDQLLDLAKAIYDQGGAEAASAPR